MSSRQLSRPQKNQLLSLLRQWRSASQDVDRLLGGGGWTGTSFDIAQLRAACDRRTDIEESLKSFWTVAEN